MVAVERRKASVYWRLRRSFSSGGQSRKLAGPDKSVAYTKRTHIFVMRTDFTGLSAP
jgi:hypothetical protein